MEFLILGPLEASDDGRPVALARGKQKALLALLLLHADRVVPMARLVDDLWGENVPDSAQKMVQIFVSQLRKQLPDGLLQTRAPGYLIRLDGHALDLRRFDGLVAEARAALAEGRAAQASVGYRQALDLWRGPALAEFEEPFAQVEAARLEEQHLACLEERLDADLGLGRHAELVGELDALVQREPHRERLRGQQMVALYRSGRQAEALESYQTFRRMLADEVGIEPSPGLRELERRMLQQDSSLQLPAAAAPATHSSPERARPPRALVGREPELAAIERFLDASPERVGVLVLEGVPGIGKTTLWEAGIDAARRRGVRVLSARASGAEAQLSFAALTDLLEDVDADLLAGLPAPQVHALEVALLRAPPGTAPSEPRAIPLGLLNVLRSLAEREPIVMAVDDVQWLDDASAEALTFAGRRLEREPVKFLLARRAASVPRLEQALERPGLRRIHVEPLGLAETGRLLHERLGLSVTRELLRRIVEATGGNPLFTVELGRSLAERGLPAAGEEMPVPPVVEDLLGTRVAALPPDVRKLLLAVALSADLRTSELAAVGGEAALDDAVKSGVLVVDRDHARPWHPLLAAAVAHDSTPAERQQLHRELARVVADEGLQAVHLALAADEPDAALAARLAEAAASAAVRGAAREAATLADHALRLTPTDAPERSDRILALGDHLLVAGEKQRLTDLIAPELESLEAGAPRVRALLLLTGGVIEDGDEIMRLYGRALAESGDDPALRARVLVWTAQHEAVIRVERIRQAEAAAVEALEICAGSGAAVERDALYALAWARSLRGRAIDAVCERFHAVSDAPVYMASSPDRVAGQRLMWRGEIDQAREVLMQQLRSADERGEPYSYALQRLHVCQLALRTGALDEAEQFLDEWAESADRELLVWPMYERCRGLLAAGRGAPDDAEAWAAKTIARAEEARSRWDILEALRARGVGALCAGQPHRAAASLGHVWEHTRREGVDDPGAFPVAADLVEAFVQLGRLDEANAVLMRLRALAEELGHPWARTSARCGAALVLLAQEPTSEVGARNAAAAAEAYGRLGLPFDRARALLSLGRAQQRGSDAATARRSLDAAAAAFEELGSHGWAELARSGVPNAAPQAT